MPATQRLPSADQNVIDAISECEQFVTTWAAQPSRKLIDLYSIIKNRLSAIFFEIEDEGIVYTVFEVLNTRGLDVTWFDRLKSLLMAVVFESGDRNTKLDTVAELHKLWTEIYRAIGLRWQSLGRNGRQSCNARDRRCDLVQRRERTSSWLFPWPKSSP
jgi:hypothetical protein